MFRVQCPAIVWMALSSWLAVACNASDRPPPYSNSSADAGAVDAGSGVPIDTYDASVPPPPEDLSNFCGSQILPVAIERPNLYFVLDRSGSMKETMPDPTSGAYVGKFRAAQRAIYDVLLAMGHRVAYGAAVYPRFGNIETCDAGNEVYPVAPGDSVTYARNGLEGPHLKKFMDSINVYVPEGGTPTSATLEKLVGPLTAIGGRTVAILATDGAPNCNEAALCDATHCIPNLEGASLPNGGECVDSYNCCAVGAYYGPKNCIDADASAAPIAALLERGIATYVIGLPGSEAYAAVLDRLAEAGGTARNVDGGAGPRYYPVSDSEQLTTALRKITAAIAISCTVTLDQAPPDWSQVNVYFDNHVVLGNPDDGWRQVDAQSLELTGSYCELLQSGDVFQVQVVAGCPTATLL
ncbi:MAG TPA: vWA domain-containing protein [Polyangiaceae bacterium]